MFDDTAPKAPGDPAAAGHPALAAPAVITGAVAELLAASGGSLSLAEVRRAVLDLHGARAAVEAAHLHLVRLLTEREDAPLHPGAPTASWLSAQLHLGRGPARRDVEAALVTDPVDGVLRGLGAALAAGRTTRAHVDVAARTLASLPTGLLTTHREVIDDLLTEQATTFCPADTRTLGVHLAARLGVEREGAPDERHERRSWAARTDWTGMTQAGGQLDPEGGALYRAVLDRLTSRGMHAAAGAPEGSAGPDGTGDPQSAPGALTASGAPDGTDPGAASGGGRRPGGRDSLDHDRRTTAQRVADAQVEMARLAAAALRLEHPTTEPPRIVVHVTPEQLAHPDGTSTACTPTDGDGHGDGDGDLRGDGGTLELPRAPDDRPTCDPPGLAHDVVTGPVDPRTLQRLVCDAVVDRVVVDRHGAVLQLESTGRLATRAQRTALAARDGGCAWPSCTAPPSWCDAHHVVWWSRGGPTTVANLVLLCPRHHTEIHAEQWEVRMRDGVPWFVPPPWVDPARTPVRNTLRSALAQVLVVAQHLAAGGGGGGGGDRGDGPGGGGGGGGDRGGGSGGRGVRTDGAAGELSSSDDP